ncbi:RNA-binding post-transcriptional regulator-like protein [Emericellopsis cladophorae]|uniref:RNA-binding post-transcriptional regulator-like protein n=1 Tax=Emericellopsis cladophorae TaxID=2686198 RepID=A0A9P9Y287_9HYPO|nr:RNA-binding post-transcriptional regulator-like protein [Emericellopsis cladophorae]KAI6781604.1 RNA-binding post-transcriptional regulator-like protein [Emericellopsis cladophorae]
MAQPPQDIGYLDYGTPANRSPGTRHNFGPFGGHSLSRQAQRPFDAPLGSSALYGAPDRNGSFHRGGMETMSGNIPSYLLDSHSPQPGWNYNGAGVATVNGAVNGPSRQRSVNRRAALPQTWTDPNMGPSGNMQGFPTGLPNSPMMNNGLRIDHLGSHASQSDLRSSPSDPESLIPTAIVIKNIPFAVRKETLASIMLEMQLPQPYAFNYHFDNGVFRGLAFANFQSAEDTRAVIEALNGMDVHGRKLRVEYKKMLPEAERERIEREKRERRGQLEEQHRAPMLHQQSSIQSLGALSQSQGRAGSHIGRPSSRRDISGPNQVGDVDLNDPQTLDFYTELAMFKRDETREVLVFPTGMAPEHRRSIHILAHHMGLEHQSMGEADSRQLTVLKRQPSPTINAPMAANPLDIHKRGLSRAATFDFAADREHRGASNNYSHMMGRQNPTLEIPDSPDATAIPNNLRAAKSFADLRSFTPSPSQASSSYLAPGASLGGGSARFGDYMSAGGHPGHAGTPTGRENGNSLIGGLNSLNLGGFDGNSLQAQARNTAGAIGSQRPGASGSNNTKNAPDRQPRNPEWENSTGFGARRANGHMARGSDSSDSGARIGATSTGSSRYH